MFSDNEMIVLGTPVRVNPVFFTGERVVYVFFFFFFRRHTFCTGLQIGYTVSCVSSCIFFVLRISCVFVFLLMRGFIG